MKKENMSQSSVDDALSYDDIFYDILLRLPPESVSKLIMVSKRWLYCICSHAFRSSYMKKWKVNSHLLGFFVCNSLYLGKPRGGLSRSRSEPALPLLSTCQEGDDLMYSGILKQLGYFIDSSDGLLLCGRHPKTYYVWDPFTKQQHQLPRPRVYFEELCMAFIVEDAINDPICYKVIRAKCERRLDEVNTVTIETYYSKTSTWYYSTLTCSSTLSLCPWTAATVVKGVVHWFAQRGHIAIYNPENEERRIRSIELPGSFDFDERVLGESSDGLLQYGLSCKSGMEIWVLEKEQDGETSICSSNTYGNTKWVLRYSLNFKIMWKKNPSLIKTFNPCSKSKETQLLSFLAQNSESVFIRTGDNIFRCHLESNKVEVVHYNGRTFSILWDFSKVVAYFKPAWPQSSLCNKSKRNQEDSSGWGSWEQLDSEENQESSWMKRLDSEGDQDSSWMKHVITQGNQEARNSWPKKKLDSEGNQEARNSWLQLDSAGNQEPRSSWAKNLESECNHEARSSWTKNLDSEGNQEARSSWTKELNSEGNQEARSSWTK